MPPRFTPRSASSPRERRVPRPLDAQRLNELALAYLARFSTSAAKLDGYLRRKLRERGWEGDGDAPVAAIVERCVAAGYVDDAVFARAKAGSLRRRGYGDRRVDQSLNAAGIAADLREEVRGSLSEARQAALALARKRRLGPYGPPPADRAAREKQIAVLLRAGHKLDIARQVLEAGTVAGLEAWAEEEEEY
ncbi:MAG: regulatory protein RecX [Novosphingobium sp.]|jgi:regulatory protein|uniref:regulatory protein RecX n=1 Tax=Novosphingobium sp. TaxID=1874826 RepID=UPI00391C8EAB|nr:RecX family transcriptional regulator [Novosphingobium sp.]